MKVNSEIKAKFLQILLGAVGSALTLLLSYVSGEIATAHQVAAVGAGAASGLIVSARS